MTTSKPSDQVPRAPRGGQRLFLGRQRYEMWSPHSPAQVSAALSADWGSELISPLEKISPVDAPGTRERSLVIAGRDAGTSPWRFGFKGSMRAEAGGTSLTGEVGPSLLVLILVLVWMSVVSLFLFSGIVAVVVFFFSGQSTLVVPWVVVPAVVLFASYALHRAAMMSAQARWRATDQWLRNLLNAREPA